MIQQMTQVVWVHQMLGEEMRTSEDCLLPITAEHHATEVYLDESVRL